MNSIPATPPAGRDGRSCRLADRPERHDTFTRHRAVGSEPEDKFLHDLPDQSRLVFIGRPFAVPFIFIPFHNWEIAGA